MRKLFISSALAGVLASAAPASAAPIRECGSTMGVRNVTTRDVDCRAARRMAKAAGFIYYGNHSFGAWRMNRRWYCRASVISPRSWWMDVRCTSRRWVVRWQIESGD
jgi:hypothetical protein